MTKTEEITADVNYIFIKDLLEMSKKKDKVFKAFIDENLFPKKSSLSDEHIKNNIYSLKFMDKKEQLIIQARAKSFEETFDPSKYFPSLLAIFGGVFAIYKALADRSGNIVIFLIYIIIMLYLFFYSARLFIKAVNIRPTAVYFNTLINKIEFESEC
ncbi:hypothetical protein [Rummeliibacillus suwonensis]|uniref:hypothetical protein n=1 Tax=Rummeliibacillus suwonensis TaxID=1306154 RepID=UPI0011B7E946|nr:hypothetical protein [Rummeliibacillus suwonensis]